MRPEKTLIVLRHAKAELGTATQDDHRRGLTKRGMEAAEAMGKYMLRHRLIPDLVLCSSAERTVKTWELIAAQPHPARGDIEVEYSEKLYMASANECLRIIAETPESAGRLLLVGHNPGLHQLCLKLAKEGDEDALDRLALTFPTCALATIGLNCPWREAAKARGILMEFVTPKEL